MYLPKMKNGWPNIMNLPSVKPILAIQSYTHVIDGIEYEFIHLNDGRFVKSYVEELVGSTSKMYNTVPSTKEEFKRYKP